MRKGTKVATTTTKYINVKGMTVSCSKQEKWSVRIMGDDLISSHCLCSEMLSSVARPFLRGVDHLTGSFL